MEGRSTPVWDRADVTPETYGDSMSIEALSPTIITGWLECEHSLTLRIKGSSAPQAFGPFADLVRAKGTAHELGVVARYDQAGLKVHHVQAKGDLTFDEWAAVNRDLLTTADADVIYQMPMVFDGIKGVADFLIRVEPEPGFSAWEPVDAKLARKEAKPGHLLQLCFYADAVAHLTGSVPKHVHLELGSGKRETYRYQDFGPYWRRMKLELGRVAEQGGPVNETSPEPCRFCDFCDFQRICEDEWRSEDSLVFVANLQRADRSLLADAGIEPSVGSVGDSYDNALAETINGLYKAEVIHRRGPWRSFEAVECATLEWVDWFNHRRLLEPIGSIPPAEAEERFYHQPNNVKIAA